MLFNTFGGDGTDALANAGYLLQFHHVATKQSVKFKAFVTNLSDQYQSSWDKEEIYGRMDAIQTFKSTQRIINVSWDIVAGSVDEAKVNLKNLSNLFNMLYPVYEAKSNSTTGMRAAPLLRMQYMNLIAREGKVGSVEESGLLGSVDGFTFEPAMDDAMFSDSQGNLYPKIVKLSCAFSVIHEHPLGWTDTTKRTANFPYGEISAPEDKGPSPKPDSVNTENIPKEKSVQEAKNQKVAQDILEKSV